MIKQRNFQDVVPPLQTKVTKTCFLSNLRRLENRDLDQTLPSDLRKLNAQLQWSKVDL